MKELIPDIVFDEIAIVHKEANDKKIEQLMQSRVIIADQETDIDKESRLFELKELKWWSDELLQAELAKGNVYTHQQFKEKVENLEYNF